MSEPRERLLRRPGPGGLLSIILASVALLAMLWMLFWLTGRIVPGVIMLLLAIAGVVVSLLLSVPRWRK